VAVLGGDGYDPSAITVRHLLHHTGGLYDYATDGDYQTAVLSDPARRWTRAEQIGFAMDHGDPLARPGVAYHYSDTGYVLVGEIIEQASGRPLAAAYRTLLGFERLGVDETYLETLEPAPTGVAPPAHQYVDDIDLVVHRGTTRV
jgi:D-alanyl-D-alanine carboxypeptidase